MEKKSDYQGWTNYETWAVSLWFDNDQGIYNMWRDTIVDLKNEKLSDDDIVVHLTDAMKDFIEDENPLMDTATVFTDSHLL